MQILNIDLAAEYLLMAALLLAIKSRMLLPRPKQEEEPEADETDPRQELIRKLLEYEQMKLAALNLNALPTVNRDYLWVNAALNDTALVLPEVTISDISRAWHSVLLQTLAAPKPEHHLKRQELSVREHMSNILRRLTDTPETAFSQLFTPGQGIAHVIVNFIAVLELTKEGLIGFTTKNSILHVHLISN